MWDQFAKAFVYFGMPAVAAYHLISGNIFLNISAQDATGFEKAGDLVLTPIRYLLCGKVAVSENGNYHIIQQFDYEGYRTLKSTISFISTPVSLPLGSLMKGIGFFSHATCERHAKIAQALASTKVNPNLDLYRRLGLSISSSFESIEPPQYHRRPGEEKNLLEEKALLKEMVRLFNENQILYWVDCGTCLGAYRYGGVIPWDEDIDVAVLQPDFQNVMNVLNQLDPEKYQVQDWSNRCSPETYIRVYVKANRNHIDIYHFSIDPKEKTVASILSNGNSDFMFESWKIRESRFIKPSSYSTIFPLKKAQFDEIEVCVPNQTKQYLQERYGENIDPIKLYNPETGQYEKDLSHPYWQLPYVD